MEILIFIAITIGGYFYFKKKEEKKQSVLINTPIKKSNYDSNLGFYFNKNQIKYNIQPTTKKNELIIKILNEKKLKCKIIDVDGTYVCIVNNSTGSVIGSVLGIIAREVEKNSWVFERAFELQTRVGKFSINEWIRLDIIVFDNIEEEEINIKYFKKGKETYLIEHIEIA